MEIKIACAVNTENKFDKKHFGDAQKYAIYKWQSNNFVFESDLNNQAINLDETELHGSKIKGNSIISTLKQQGVKLLVSRQFGKNILMVNKHFIPVIIASENVEEALTALKKSIKWIIEDLERQPDKYKLFDLRSGTLKLKI